MTLAENVKRLREAAGLSQPELARRVGCSPSQIQQIESGAIKSTKYIFALSRSLNVGISELDPAAVGVETPMHEEPPPVLGDRNDFPIFAAAEGGNGAVIVTWEPVEDKHKLRGPWRHWTPLGAFEIKSDFAMGNVVYQVFFNRRFIAQYFELGSAIGRLRDGSLDAEIGFPVASAELPEAVYLWNMLK